MQEDWFWNQIEEIKEYINDTGICPYCGKSSLIPSELNGADESLLYDMHIVFSFDREE